MGLRWIWLAIAVVWMASADGLELPGGLEKADKQEEAAEKGAAEEAALAAAAVPAAALTVSAARRPTKQDEAVENGAVSAAAAAVTALAVPTTLNTTLERREFAPCQPVCTRRNPPPP